MNAEHFLSEAAKEDDSYFVDGYYDDGAESIYKAMKAYAAFKCAEQRVICAQYITASDIADAPQPKFD